MTDQHKGYVVVLEDDVREDDAEPIINAIKQVRGVLDVVPVDTRGLDDVIIEQRVRHDLGVKLFQVVYPENA